MLVFKILKKFKILRSIELILIVLTVVYAIAWVINPKGNYEPWIVLFTTVGLLITEIGRRYFKHEENSKSTGEINSIDSQNFLEQNNDEKNQSLDPSESSSFFAARFGLAFPGCREIKWYNGKEAIERLSKLLEEPLKFKNKDGEMSPIWWWRDGNMPIENFRTISRREVLLDIKELKIGKVAAVYSTIYYRCFVYVEAEPMKPTGIYEWNEEKIKKWVQEIGYAYEEYGLYKGKIPISRAEYDDNATLIKDKLVTLGKDVELRNRYITPYNFVIAPHSSPINNNCFDQDLINHLNMMIKGKATIEELKDKVEKLPKARMWGM